MDSQITSYRTCFTTDAGRRVLAHLLTEAGYFDYDLKTSEEMAVLNFAKKILVNLGIGNTPESVSQIVNQLLNILPERINNGSSPGQPA